MGGLGERCKLLHRGSTRSLGTEFRKHVYGLKNVLVVARTTAYVVAARHSS